jgi:hypothetical protein
MLSWFWFQDFIKWVKPQLVHLSGTSVALTGNVSFKNRVSFESAIVNVTNRGFILCLIANAWAGSRDNPARRGSGVDQAASLIHDIVDQDAVARDLPAIWTLEGRSGLAR